MTSPQVSELSPTKEIFSFPSPPPEREQTNILHIFLPLLFADENDQNSSLACCKAISTSDSIWEYGHYFTKTDIYSIFPLNSIVSGSATNVRNPSKCTQ
jgi:hypothetical protein